MRGPGAEGSWENVMNRPLVKQKIRNLEKNQCPLFTVRRPANHRYMLTDSYINSPEKNMRHCSDDNVLQNTNFITVQGHRILG